ncbi:MAG: membrane associated rhomboid family serine protease [Bradymonadia bacterium]|jgi:membrane associated rhomboid family serine protease
MNPAEYLSMLAMIIALSVLGASRRQATLAWPEAAWATLVSGGAGLLLYQQHLMALSVAIAGVGLLMPALVFNLARRWAGQGHFARAARLGRVLAAVRRDPQMDRWIGLWQALAEFYGGDAVGVERLRAQLSASTDASALVVLDVLTVLTRDWERARFSPALDAQSRALCEMGEVQQGISTIGPLLMGRPSLRRLRTTRGVLLAPLAFAGRVQVVDALTRLMRLRPVMREIWRATALAAAGRADEARALLDRAERRSPAPVVRAAIVARRARLPGAVALSPAVQDILKTAETEILAGLRLQLRAPWRDWATLALLGVIGWFFWRQVQAGSGSSPQVAWLLGALEGGRWPQEPWRLLTYGALHIGVMHLTVNCLAIAALAPIISDAVGRVAMLLIFVASVAGGGIAVIVFGGVGITVGASGGAMGLLGSLVTILWMHPGVATTLTGKAGARFGLSVIAFQTVFDIVMPEISFASHGGGALAGAAVTAGIILLMKAMVWRPRSA